MKIDCAFCSGTGLDPFGVPPHLSKCRVCSGRGWVSVTYEKTATCVYCKGSGKKLESRLTCPVCMGKGVIRVVKEPAMKCPACGGTGRSPTSKLPCLRCGGKGAIEVKR